MSAKKDPEYESFGDILANPGFKKPEDIPEGERLGWQIAFIGGLAAGFLSRHTRNQIDLDIPINLALVLTRDKARDALEARLTDHSDLPLIDHLHFGIDKLVDEYLDVLPKHPGLQHDLKVLKDVQHWVHTHPAINEGFALMVFNEAKLIP